ncbi:MAG TPA: alpha/beta hydrolase, partial [Acidimicrobiales bacterium]
MTLLERMASFDDPPWEQQSPEDFRALRKSRWRQSQRAVHAIDEVDAGGVPARLYRPSEATGLPLLVWLHGGGWVGGDLDSHDDLCRAVAVRAGAVVLSVDYGLAPERPFPGGLTDALDALRWAHEHAADLGADPALVALGGDSAGGNIAAVVSQLAPVPLVFQVLVYPVTDARFGWPSFTENGEGLFLTAAGMRWFLNHYLSGGQGAADDPRVSPLLAPDDAFRAQPPTLVITAEYDPLRDEGEAYAARMIELGVPCTLTRYDGMIHGFVTLADY